MKYLWTTSTLLLLGLVLCSAGSLTPTLRLHAKRQLPQSNFRLADLIQEFALDVSYYLDGGEQDNVLFSPLSINSLLSLLMSGTSGPTYTELKNLLYTNGVKDVTIHNSYRMLIQLLSEGNRDVIVKIATRLFLASHFNIQNDFIIPAQTNYKASTVKLDFQQRPAIAMDEVNKWVSRETEGKIPQLITQPFDPKTTFVAANTVYFNGAWQYPFDPFQTKNSNFSIGSTNISIPMMRTTMTIPYIDIPALNAEMIVLPYKDYGYGLFLVRPKGPANVRTLKDIEGIISAGEIHRYISQMVNSTRSIALPKMRLEYKTYLKDTLRNLNVDSIFNPKLADFSRLTDKHQNAWVNDVIHQTVVEITETGTVAVAATAVSLNRIGTTKNFEVNKPCIFFIRHMTSGTPLFWGRIMKPDLISSKKS